MNDRPLSRREKERRLAEEGRMPPGQSLTEKFPVLHYGRVPDFDPDTWDFRVWGEVEEEVRWSWQEFQSLPRTKVTLDIHCVTRWSKLDTRWEGVSLDVLLDQVDISAEAAFVMVYCYGGYTTNLPLADVREGRAFVAYRYDGAPLEPDHGGPARLVVPHLYFWKSAKWIRGLRLMQHDQPGFWERLGYHDYGDPWREQRHRGD